MGTKAPRGRSNHSFRPGHYGGTTSQGEPITFDFTERKAVTNLVATLANGSRTEILTISAFFPVRRDGRWGGIVSAADVTLHVHGRLREDGNAEGTLHAQLNGIGRASRSARLTLSWSARG
jgi:hypothetical protein